MYGSLCPLLQKKRESALLPLLCRRLTCALCQSQREQTGRQPRPIWRTGRRLKQVLSRHTRGTVPGDCRTANGAAKSRCYDIMQSCAQNEMTTLEIEGSINSSEKYGPFRA
jgi:hypothetical protein